MHTPFCDSCWKASVTKHVLSTYCVPCHVPGIRIGHHSKQMGSFQGCGYLSREGDRRANRRLRVEKAVVEESRVSKEVGPLGNGVQESGGNFPSRPAHFPCLAHSSHVLSPATCWWPLSFRGPGRWIVEVSSWVSECCMRREPPDAALSTGVLTHLQAALLETASDSVYF